MAGIKRTTQNCQGRDRIPVTKQKMCCHQVWKRRENRISCLVPERDKTNILSMAYKVLALKSGVDSWQLHEQELRDACTNEDVNKHRVVLEALEHVDFVMKFPRVDLVEYLHEDKRVENHCEML